MTFYRYALVPLYGLQLPPGETVILRTSTGLAPHPFWLVLDGIVRARLMIQLVDAKNGRSIDLRELEVIEFYIGPHAIVFESPITADQLDGDHGDAFRSLPWPERLGGHDVVLKVRNRAAVAANFSGVLWGISDVAEVELVIGRDEAIEVAPDCLDDEEHGSREDWP